MTDDHQPTYTLSRGTAPLLISIPHLGTRLPEEVRAQLSDIATVLQDTDWHLDRLYGFAAELGATVLQAEVSRYAIDLNRPPNDVSLYPGQTTTSLCPTETFHGEPLYPALPEAHADATAEANATTAGEPAATSALPQTITAAERERRLRTYWQPITPHLRLSSAGCALPMAPFYCGTRTRLPAAYPDCSMASCPISTSVRLTARVAPRRSSKVRAHAPRATRSRKC